MKRWALAVAWPDGRHRALDVEAETREEAARYPLDIWGASVTVTVTLVPCTGCGSGEPEPGAATCAACRLGLIEPAAIAELRG